MALTFVLGAAFLGLELREFTGLVARGAGPSRSAFLSALLHASSGATACTSRSACSGC